jgi:hypothetical protein
MSQSLADLEAKRSGVLQQFMELGDLRHDRGRRRDGVRAANQFMGRRLPRYQRQTFHSVRRGSGRCREPLYCGYLQSADS